MSHTYEIEIKSLLGETEKMESLKKKLHDHGSVEFRGSHAQLNHYFNTPENLSPLVEALLPHIPEGRREALEKILEEGEDHSIRTRDADGRVFFVVKASLDEGTSSNTVSRIEFEEEVGMTLEELDALLLAHGLTYQAKWSRDREEYTQGATNITIDRNAGYGYLAEFERVVEDKDAIEETKEELLALMAELGVEELSQERLERMFSFYNENWRDYYGTDKVFIIE